MEITHKWWHCWVSESCFPRSLCYCWAFPLCEAIISYFLDSSFKMQPEICRKYSVWGCSSRVVYNSKQLKLGKVDHCVAIRNHRLSEQLGEWLRYGVGCPHPKLRVPEFVIPSSAPEWLLPANINCRDTQVSFMLMEHLHWVLSRWFQTWLRVNEGNSSKWALQHLAQPSVKWIMCYTKLYNDLDKLFNI